MSSGQHPFGGRRGGSGGARTVRDYDPHSNVPVIKQEYDDDDEIAAPLAGREDRYHEGDGRAPAGPRNPTQSFRGRTFNRPGDRGGLHRRPPTESRSALRRFRSPSDRKPLAPSRSRTTSSQHRRHRSRSFSPRASSRHRHRRSRTPSRRRHHRRSRSPSSSPRRRRHRSRSRSRRHRHRRSSSSSSSPKRKSKRSHAEPQTSSSQPSAGGAQFGGYQAAGFPFAGFPSADAPSANASSAGVPSGGIPSGDRGSTSSVADLTKLRGDPRYNPVFTDEQNLAYIARKDLQVKKKEQADKTRREQKKAAKKKAAEKKTAEKKAAEKKDEEKKGKEQEMALKLQKQEYEIMMLKLKNQEQEISLKETTVEGDELAPRRATRAELQDAIHALRRNALEILSVDQTEYQHQLDQITARLQPATAHIYDAQESRSSRMATQGVLHISLRHLRDVVTEVEALMNSHHQLVSRGTFNGTIDQLRALLNEQLHQISDKYQTFKLSRGDMWETQKEVLDVQFLVADSYTSQQPASTPSRPEIEEAPSQLPLERRQVQHQVSVLPGFPQQRRPESSRQQVFAPSSSVGLEQSTSLPASDFSHSLQRDLNPRSSWYVPPRLEGPVPEQGRIIGEVEEEVEGDGADTNRAPVS
ncbi:MAG: hypothetical protein Q9211_005070 [Gyalolechia sp. 1 TL-2023]